MSGANFEFSNVDCRGRVFSNFYARKDHHTGPGWYIFGRNPEYGGRLIALCARPRVKARRYPYYNCAVRRGWHTKREAQSIADQLNQALSSVSQVSR